LSRLLIKSSVLRKPVLNLLLQLIFARIIFPHFSLDFSELRYFGHNNLLLLLHLALAEWANIASGLATKTRPGNFVTLDYDCPFCITVLDFTLYLILLTSIALPLQPFQAACLALLVCPRWPVAWEQSHPPALCGDSGVQVRKCDL